MNQHMPISRYRLPILVLIGFAALGCAGILFLALHREVPVVRASAVVDSGADLKLERGAAINAALPVAVDTGPRPPGRLIIPSIGVNAPVEQVGVDSTGAMGVPTQSGNTAWYKLGPSPGDAGDAVIDGHLDWYDTPRAVFFSLKDMRVGDDIQVQRIDGVVHHFRVTDVQSVAYNATVPGLFANAGPPRLSLITCGGKWDTRLGQYLQRVIVDSSMVS
jgi:LPXTG-site transpeptidase (sortase) family protein